MAGNFDAKTDPLAPTHPIAPKFFLVVDKKILNTGCGYGEYAWLLRTGRALDARAEPRIKSADVHDETEAQHLILGVALERLPRGQRLSATASRAAPAPHSATTSKLLGGSPLCQISHISK